jgi:hypothetical protein
MMFNATRLKFGSLVVAALLLGGLTGCSEGHARYKPTADEARTSLEKALTAWKDGKPYGPIEATPPIHVVDSAWQGGQQIESFQIGDEEDGDDATKQFVVKLKTKKAPAEQDVRFVVHGRDPVWVFREDDYKRTLNMENNPVSTPKSKAGGPRSGKKR